MKSKLLAAVAAIAVLTAAGVARAETTDVTALKAQAAALKKQNEALEKRLNKIEKQQSAQAAAPAPASTDFMASITKGPMEVISNDGPICWKGICAFGTLDTGIGWDSHGMPQNSHMYAPVADLINKNGNHANMGMIPGGGLSASGVGIKGEQEILPGLSAIFYGKTTIDLQSGQLANSSMSIIDNNGVAQKNVSNFADGSRGGQAFNDQLYAGLASKEYGQLTFGRQWTLAQDDIIAYDPAGGAYAFSVIGLSGTAAGGGYTEDTRMDNMIKYRLNYGPVHVGAMYKMVDGNALQHNDAYQVNVGGEYAGFSIDGVAGRVNQAISASNLSAAQMAGLNTYVNSGGVTNTVGNANTNTMAGTVTDNTMMLVNAKYTWNQFKFFAGYEHLLFQNPHEAVGAGDQAVGGYTLSSINAYSLGSDKTLQIFWLGSKYAVTSQFDLTLSYYHYLQNAYTAIGTTAGTAYVSGPAVAANGPSTPFTKTGPCNTVAHGNCSGTLDAVSFFGDYHFNKRFDVYAGIMWSNVNNGLANGYLYHNNFAPSAGVRYAF